MNPSSKVMVTSYIVVNRTLGFSDRDHDSVSEPADSMSCPAPLPTADWFHLSKCTQCARAVRPSDVIRYIPGEPTTFQKSWRYGIETGGLPISHSPLIRSAPHGILWFMALRPRDRGPLMWGIAGLQPDSTRRTAHGHQGQQQQD